MKPNRKRKYSLISLAGVAVLAAGLWYVYSSDLFSQKGPTVAEAKVYQEGGLTVKEFELTAKEGKQTLKDGVKVDTWTYNGYAPGNEIHVTEGDRVRVKLKNDLSKPVSIHWHGVPVPNAMDGIPGITQNAVRPGETFTYDFVATIPGTYWYHSHQNSVEQEDRGLYGAFIVDPKNPTVKYDRDYTLVLDEWQTGSMPGMNMGNGSMSGMDHSKMNMGNSNMQGMDHNNMNMGGSSNNQSSSPAKEMAHDEMMKMMYNVFTVNGKAGASIKPLEVKPGDKVKLRFINAGFQTHKLHLQGQSFRITHTDGQPIANGPDVTDQLLAIAPGERYDVEFTADTKGNWSIDSHDDSPAAGDMVIPVQYTGDSSIVNKETNGKTNMSPIDITKYGKAQPIDPNTKYDVEQKLVLDLKVVNQNGQESLLYTINGKAFPDTDPIMVKKGQRVKLTLTNPSKYDHPMHLHGHFFQVLSKNGQPISGSPLMKDTLNVRPGESYEIAFVADNDGNWMLHCHDLHHASAGMMTEVKYEGFKPAFTPDPSVGNMAE